MSLNLDRSTRKRVKLGDVVLRSRIQVDPFDGGVDRYVAGGHIDTDSVIIQRSGDVADGQMGSTFRYVFQPGQVLFVSARPYLRKTGIPNFGGVVADKTYVLEATPNNGLLQDMLPFLLTSDRFIEYANQEATGSMNPRLLWGAMQRYEFALPSLDEQKRLADLLWATEWHEVQLHAAAAKARLTSSALITELRQRIGGSVPLREVATVRNGQTFPKRLQGSAEGDVPFFKVSDLDSPGNERWLTRSANWVKESDVAAIGARLMAPGTIVMARVGAAIKMERRRMLACSSLVDDNHLVITPLSIDGVFLWAVLSETALSANRNDGVVPSLNQAIVGAVPIPDCRGQEAEHVGRSYLAAHETSDKLIAEARATRALRAVVLSSVFGESE